MAQEDKTEDLLFVMAQPETFTWPVKVRVPRAGKYGEAVFMAEFPNLEQAQIDELLANDELGRPLLSDRQIAERVLLNFEPIKQPDGSMLTFSPEVKAVLLGKPRVAAAVMGTFIAVSRGVAAEKNS